MRPLSCAVPSGGGGGSSRIFPWSPEADAIQWGGGGSRGQYTVLPTNVHLV